MHYVDLLERMQKNEAEAFLEMTDRYGWGVYSAIREKYKDHDMADKVYNETMHAFYHSLSDSNAEDPVEALLLGFADRISPERLLFDHDAPGEGKVKLNLSSYFGDFSSPMMDHSSKKPISFWNGIAALILVMILSCCLWIIAGFLMKINMIPFVDLGYSWLDTVITSLL